MIDLHKQKLSFRLRCLGRNLAARKGIWNILGGLELLLNSDFDTWNVKHICKHKLPAFYIEILQAWLKIKTNVCIEYQPKVHGVQYEILWHNKNVTFHNTPFFMKIGINLGYYF